MSWKNRMLKGMTLEPEESMTFTLHLSALTDVDPSASLADLLQSAFPE